MPPSPEGKPGGTAITALGIDFSWLGHVGRKPGAAGHLAPCIETSYYADLTKIALATVSRADILTGYLALWLRVAGMLC